MTDSAPPRSRSGTRPRAPLIVVVEDDDATRDLCAAELAGAGFMVLEAASGEAALEKTRQFIPHAVVLDLVLPGLDGCEVARAMRADERTREVAIVALTALTSARAEQAALEAGCDSFLTKPVPPSALVAELVRVIARRARGAAAPDMTRVVGRPR